MSCTIRDPSPPDFSLMTLIKTKYWNASGSGFPPSFPPSRTLAFYVIKWQNCLNICNRVYILRRPQSFAKSSPYFWLCTVVKSKVEILQNFEAFSEYMNFNYWCQKSGRLLQIPVAFLEYLYLHILIAFFTVLVLPSTLNLVHCTIFMAKKLPRARTHSLSGLKSWVLKLTFSA